MQMTSHLVAIVGVRQCKLGLGQSYSNPVNHTWVSCPDTEEPLLRQTVANSVQVELVGFGIILLSVVFEILKETKRIPKVILKKKIIVKIDTHVYL